MASYLYNKKVRFENLTNITTKLLEIIALSKNEKRLWNSAGMPNLLGMPLLNNLSKNMLKVQQITKNLIFQCTYCKMFFKVDSMNTNFTDGKISAEGKTWELSKLNKCPLCAGEFIRVCVRAGDRLTSKSWWKFWN